MAGLGRFGFVGDRRGVGLMVAVEMLMDKAKRVPVPRGSDTALIADGGARRAAL